MCFPLDLELVYSNLDGAAGGEKEVVVAGAPPVLCGVTDSPPTTVAPIPAARAARQVGKQGH
jgi:hypothetical protein